MKDIDLKAYLAFKHKRNLRLKNTRVKVVDGESYMYLFGNLIAKTEKGKTLINHCNWISATTQARLSAFITLRRSKGEFIVNERFVWEDGWLDVNNCR